MKSQKQQAAEETLKLVKDGTKIGIGSGSTVNEFIVLLGEAVKDGLQIQAVTASQQSKRLAKQHGIPIIDFPEHEKLSIVIDGADEVELSSFQALKGGGGSLVREKLVAAAGETFVLMVDEHKIVQQLGHFTLPVEVIPFGWQKTAERIKQLGGKPQMRKGEEGFFISDNHNYILDCDFGLIKDPNALHQSLKQLVGVVETGLFIDMVDGVYVAGGTGVRYIQR
ncbi:ribose-5-phosphate isomerase RpiA [Alkalicoccobacillus porphyridii]|uniref:Ribose-5-phosphate isomerase A n=1 Tax=Alkalicoccobacillus porphyridii TaxID=2597270 RepID=A0A554A2A4_9BACI|nr:ribose-5-phosphate isomerase RpiA [Alkalicoccobacillus porphyridii]TSB47818.1 ribose-5-phosphate isomerase RpiA [Alkalicoccobacillus porphyridii]